MRRSPVRGGRAVRCVRSVTESEAAAEGLRSMHRSGYSVGKRLPIYRRDDFRTTTERNTMANVREIGIIMNGVSGRMGYRQHLVRSILAIRDQGGIELSDGTRVTVKPLLVGRSEAKLAELAAKHGIEDWTTD